MVVGLFHTLRTSLLLSSVILVNLVVLVVGFHCHLYQGIGYLNLSIVPLFVVDATM